MIQTTQELKALTNNLRDFTSVNLLDVRPQHLYLLPQEQKNQLFVLKSQKHNGYYNYKKSNYTNAKTKVEIICPVHGSFWQIPEAHWNGQGCPICGKTKSQSANTKNKKTTEQFVIKSQEVHGKDEHDYSEAKYVNSKTKVKIKHNKCGKFFWQLPEDHIKGHGCLECGNQRMQKTHEQFVKEVEDVHGSHLSVIGEYQGKRTKIRFRCNDCGKISLNMPKNVLDGNKCNHCKSSRGEKQIAIILEKTTLNFQTQHHFNKHPFLRSKTSYLAFDFYLPDYNLCIEYDGQQHYESVKHWGGTKQFGSTQLRDQLKNQFCLDNNIRLLRIPYWVNLTPELILSYLEENFTVANVRG